MSSFEFSVEDAEILAALRRMIELGRNPLPAMRDIASLGERTTRARFRTESGPDGRRWEPSLRAKIVGGRTLTKDAHLGNSVSWNVGGDYAEWGVNRIYAAIHQFGGDIRAKGAGSLRFKLASGGFASVKKVRIPPRPFLGVSEGDAKDILEILQRKLIGGGRQA